MAVTEVQGIRSNSGAVPALEKGGVQAERDNIQAAAPPVSKQPEVTVPAEKRKVEAAEEKRRVEAAAQQLNDYLKRNSIQLKFSVDADTKEIVVKVMQKQTGKVIRQIPSEEALKLMREFEPQDGVIVKQTV